MALLDRDRRRLNRAMPINCDIQLGDIIQEMQEKVEEGGEIDAYTKAESDAKFQPKGSYATTTQLGEKADKTYVDTEFEKKANVGVSYTKTESDGKYQTKGSYATKAELEALAARVQALEDAASGGS